MFWPDALDFFSAKDFALKKPRTSVFCPEEGQSIWSKHVFQPLKSALWTNTARVLRSVQIVLLRTWEQADILSTSSGMQDKRPELCISLAPIQNVVRRVPHRWKESFVARGRHVLSIYYRTSLAKTEWWLPCGCLHQWRYKLSALTPSLKQLLVRPKDWIPTEELAGFVYLVPCASCPASYIGQTGKCLGKWMKEQRKAVESGVFANSALIEHA